MSNGNSLSQRWQEYRPSKAVWFWSCVACIVLTMIVGFTAGGWVTGGTARSMAAQAEQDARETLVASICVDRFLGAPNAQSKLTELKDTSSWQRDDFIVDGGWSKIVALNEQIPGAADVCAERLVAMEEIPASSGKPQTTAGDSEAAG